MYFCAIQFKLSLLQGLNLGFKRKATGWN